MAGSSDRSIYGGTWDPPKKLLSEKNTKLHMSSKNSGGDPVTALALRPESSSYSATERQERVAREMAEALAQL
ncbi:hypothetical protein PG985_009512 [Apiospora marii]|uniref:uncharacterized protein n=1 Tax=Apiospora marii TaxID=335849 RepID=UPI00313161EF